MNKLYFGDNLEILREMSDEHVHLRPPTSTHECVAYTPFKRKKKG